MPSIKLTSAQAEWIKWLALASMLADHIGRILLDSHTPTAVMLTSVGRLAFPLFSFLLAHNLVYFSQHPRRYLVWILTFAVLSQPVFIHAFPNSSPLNIFATLGFGLVFLLALQHWNKTHTWPYGALLLGLGILAGIFGHLFDYGVIGIALPAAWWLWLQRPKHGGMTALLLVFLLLLNLSPQGLAGVLSLPLIVFLQRCNLPPLPRLPRLFFYGFYPLHLLVLLFLKS